jgi:hypothetical protein
MVLALDGWVDGGESATGSVRFLRRKLRPRKLAEIPPGRFHIYQVPGQLSLRPYTRVEDGLVRQYTPPRNIFHYWQNPVGDEDLILFQGTEPHMNWNDYSAAILEVAREFGAGRMYMLGGVLDKMPHTRELQSVVRLQQRGSCATSCAPTASTPSITRGLGHRTALVFQCRSWPWRWPCSMPGSRTIPSFT